MTVSPPPLLSLSLEPRRCLALFDIADDPEYAALEVQAFDDPLHGTGILVLLAHHDGTVDIHRQATLRLEPTPFAVGRGIGTWREAVIEPARIEVCPDGLVVDVAFADADGRTIEVVIDDRDGIPRRRSTLLAPVSSGVERPSHLLVVLLRDFDLGRTSGHEPRLVIDGVTRTVKPFPGPSWLTRRRFIRYSAAPLIATAIPDVDGPVAPESLGPVSDVCAVATNGAEAAIHFVPAIPELASMADGSACAGRWTIDVAHVAPVFGGTWTAARVGDRIHLGLAVTEPWRPRALPRSLRLVTTLAAVFRTWPTTYRWDAEIELGASPPHARSRWTRTSAPDRANAYGVRGRVRRSWLLAGLVAAGSAVAGLSVAARRRRRT